MTCEHVGFLWQHKFMMILMIQFSKEKKIQINISNIFRIWMINNKNDVQHKIINQLQIGQEISYSQY